ncbi:hypothetical protein [Modestobacter sp. Leaf380]|uniref:hypothetical protein n=1 Tax=Modestobacter sp. Leaf380 TaxID=1736356 RepID=UPI0012F99743|nr:hypothetical protein [Modestobacter sp. Leaf380]
MAALLGGCAGGPTTDVVLDARPSVAAQPTVVADAGPPGPDNTGVPADVDLRPSDDLYITQPGSVIDGLDVDGCVVVRASDVVIRNSRIRCAEPVTANVVQVENGATGLVIEDTEIDGLGEADIAVGWSDYTLRRVDIHSTNDGVRLGDDVLIEDSWIHDMIRQGGLHPDCIQATTGSDITVRNNTLDVYNRERDDLNNAAVQLGSETGPRLLERVLIEDNYLNGGNYTVNVRGDTNFQDVVFRGNRYGTDSRYGPAMAPGGVEFSSERMDEGDTDFSVTTAR